MANKIPAKCPFAEIQGDMLICWHANFCEHKLRDGGCIENGIIQVTPTKPMVEVEKVVEDINRINKERKICQTCNGDGVIWDERWKEFTKKYPYNGNEELWKSNEIDKKLLEFFCVSNVKNLPPEEPPCIDCDGNGWIYFNNTDLIAKYKQLLGEK